MNFIVRYIFWVVRVVIFLLFLRKIIPHRDILSVVPSEILLPKLLQIVQITKVFLQVPCHSKVSFFSLFQTFPDQFLINVP